MNTPKTDTITADISGLKVIVSAYSRFPNSSDYLVVDMARPQDQPNTVGGPRVFIERQSDNKAWRILIHPDDGAPSHSVLVNDNHKTTVKSH